MKQLLILSITIILNLSGLKKAQAQNAEVEGSITLIKDAGTTLSVQGKSRDLFFPGVPTPQLETKLTIGYQQGVNFPQFPSANKPEETFIRSPKEILNIEAGQAKITGSPAFTIPLLDVQGVLRVGNQVITNENLYPGMIRFNAESERFEGYDGYCWVIFNVSPTPECNILLIKENTTKSQD